MMDLRTQQLGEVELKLFSDGQSVDWYLQRLVSIANASDLEVGITLVVSGAVVSGRLIGGRRYFEEFAKEFSDAWPGDAKDRIRDAFARHGEIYSPGSEEDKALPPQFIHLADARCFYPGSQLPNNRGVLWRGKINAVSGFSLGALSTDQEA